MWQIQLKQYHLVFEPLTFETFGVCIKVTFPHSPNDKQFLRQLFNCQHGKCNSNLSYKTLANFSGIILKKHLFLMKVLFTFDDVES